jgi:hypothetical protein
MNSTTNDYLPLAEKLLSDLWQMPVQCEVIDTMRDEGRNRVYRLKVTGGLLESVIFKACVGGANRPYQVGDDTYEHPFHCFCNEWAGSEMLAPLGLGPRAIAGDITQGFLILEDLGEGESLADRLQGTDAQAAENALLAYARSLGIMARATHGKLDEWEALRRTKGGTRSGCISEAETWYKNVTIFTNICGTFGISTLPTVADETERIGKVLENPGDYLAFTPSDCCPDNHFLRGDTVIFFDNEGAGMRHALLELAYVVAPFPSCWCVNRLPEGMRDKLIAAYKSEYAGDANFHQHLLYMVACWTIGTITLQDYGPFIFENILEADGDWGISTVRQRHPLRLENFLAFPNADRELTGFTQMATALLDVLKTRWSDVPPMPLYPPFRPSRRDY